MGKDHLGTDQRKVKEKDEDEKEIKALDEKDIALLKSYGQGQYTKALKVDSYNQHSMITHHSTFRRSRRISWISRSE
jgi:hypothetical protein